MSSKKVLLSTLIESLKLNKYLAKYAKYLSAWKYRELTNWIYNPPTQEYVLPKLFGAKPSFMLWLKRRFRKDNLTLYAQYFNPSALIHNTMRKNFMEYHAKLIPFAGLPPWAETKAEKCELYPCSKLIEAMIEAKNEMSSMKSAAPTPRSAKDEAYEYKFREMLNHAYNLLEEKYNKENPELIEIMKKEKEYLLEKVQLSRDERRELEFLRRAKLYNRIDEMQKLGVQAEQVNLLRVVLDDSKDCYSYYVMFKEFVKLNQQAESKVMLEAFGRLGFDKMEPSEKTAMPCEDQFNMKFDELYVVMLERPKPNKIVLETVLGNQKNIATNL